MTETTRIALWPVSPLPMPLVESGPVRLNADGVLEAWEGSGSAYGAHPIPDELYLRGLSKLRLDDASAVVAFTEQYGPLRAPDMAGVLLAADPDSQGIREAADRIRSRVRQLREAVLEDLVNVKDEWMGAARDALASGDSESAARSLTAARWPEPQRFCHIEEVRASVTVLRDLVRVWLATQGLIPFVTVQNEWESPLRPGGDPPEPWPTETQARRMLVAALNSGLEEVHPRLTLQTPGEASRESSDLPVTSLFGALCVQFANDAAEGVTYHHCENKKCGDWFVHQSGRSASGGTRTKGVQYCSVQCARAVAQRAHYRRRLESAGGVRPAKNTMDGETTKALRTTGLNIGSSGAKKPTARRNKRATGGAA